MQRDDKDYAIEFGEYLATAAERFLQAVNDLDEAEIEGMDEVEEQERAESRSEAWSALQSAVYEFRKRATRAGHEPSAIKFNR